MKKLLLIILFIIISCNLYSSEIINEVASINGIQYPNLLDSKDGNLYTYSYYNVFKSTDKGINWNKIFNSDYSFFINSIVDIKNDEGKTIFFANFVYTNNGGNLEGFIYYSNDSCKSWVKSNLAGSSVGVAHVFATPSNKLFFALLDGQGNSTLMISNDFGKTAQVFKDSVNVDKISEMPDSTLVLYFYRQNIIKHPKESQWRALPFESIVVSKDNMLLVQDSVISFSKDKGLTIEKTSIFNYNYNYNLKLFGDGEGNFYASLYTISTSVMHDTSFIYKYNFQGNTWDKLNWSFDIINNIKKLPTGEIIFDNALGLLSTKDDFKTYKEINSGLDYIKISSLINISKDSYFIGIPDGVSFKTTDAGKTWKRILGLPRISTDQPFKSSFKTKSGNLLISVSDRIYCSTDKGESWINAFENFSYTNSMNFYEDSFGNILLPCKNMILISKDNGLNWDVIKVFSEGLVFNITEADGMYAVSTTFGISILNYSFQDFSLILENYRIQFLATTDGNSVFGLGMQPANTNYYVFLKKNGSNDVNVLPIDLSNADNNKFQYYGIRTLGESAYLIYGKYFYSINPDGSINKEYNSFINDYCITFSKAKGDLFVGSANGKIYQITNSTDVNDNSVENLINISPNPASDYIEISLDSPFFKGGQGVSLEIFNIFGEKTTPSNLSGLPPLLAKEGMMKIDISNLPAGVYFIKIGDIFEKFVKM